MRFDDRLDTILRQNDDPLRSPASNWSHILSILAQKSGLIPPDQQRQALERAEALRARVPLERRKFLARSLAFRVKDAALALHFGTDVASVAAPVMSTAKLADGAWSDLIPALPPASRALLRERRDLPDAARDMLGLYGPGDRALPPATPQSESPAIAPSDDTNIAPSDDTNVYHLQISDLMARIEAYRQVRQPDAASLIEAEPAVYLSTNFRFETDRAGIINWVDGVNRGPIIGISFADNSGPRAFGVDGYAAGAFRKRTQFRDARLRVAGNSDAAGDWLISADPCFDSSDGRFRGYRGYGRRPDRSHQSEKDGDSLFSSDMSPDAVRQLVHELRSPINAIRGFAEMIDSQMLGPVSHPYRIRARSIIADSSRLIDIVESVDLAARLKFSSQSPVNAQASDLVAMIEGALDRVEVRTEASVDRFTLSTISDLPLAAVDFAKGSELLERIMLTALTAAPGTSRISIDISRRPGQLMISFDHGAVPGSTAIDHGLGFALRVIKQCSSELGGQFSADSHKFTLILPQTHDSEMKTIESI